MFHNNTHMSILNILWFLTWYYQPSVGCTQLHISQGFTSLNYSLGLHKMCSLSWKMTNLHGMWILPNQYITGIGTIVTSTCVICQKWPLNVGTWFVGDVETMCQVASQIGFVHFLCFLSISHKTNAKFCLFLDMCDSEAALDSHPVFNFDEAFAIFWHLTCQNLYRKRYVNWYAQSRLWHIVWLVKKKATCQLTH